MAPQKHSTSNGSTYTGQAPGNGQGNGQGTPRATQGQNTTSLEQMIAALQAENAKLRKQAEVRNTLTLKVSEKGACSLYGLGRFPVSLYKTQWERLLEFAPQIRSFLEANSGVLATKDSTKDKASDQE